PPFLPASRGSYRAPSHDFRESATMSACPSSKPLPPGDPNPPAWQSTTWFSSGLVPKPPHPPPDSHVSNHRPRQSRHPSDRPASATVLPARTAETRSGNVGDASRPVHFSSHWANHARQNPHPPPRLQTNRGCGVNCLESDVGAPSTPMMTRSAYHAIHDTSL